ncbi:MAG: hypothetical protein ACR2HJ_04115 [Fimbriimonadales bacterium]
MHRILAVAVLLPVCIAGCNKHTLHRDIIGVWENSGAPTSTAVDLSVRKSDTWRSTIHFEPDGKLTWRIEDGSPPVETWSGRYEVDGPSVTLVLTELDHVPLTAQLNYTIRLRGKTLSLPVPADWAGPTVEYTHKPSA